ncbi:MAG: tRNA (pseudouridine(54)-N(1))-methyltransferase TrmY [Methanotrichaceae archaeon]|nr:tRNA (pseudouridine(54)-N(1))-methyltransferase TrmY [Methanotrichaceae archaeon]
MRTFVIVGHKATTSAEFSLEDIPGTSGRLDILCRCINSGLVLSHGIRHDVAVYLVLLGGEIPKTVWLRGEDLRHLNPDERTTAALIKKALALQVGPHWTRSTPGIMVREGGLSSLVEELDPPLYLLREDGRDVREADIATGVFVLGDHMGLEALEEDLLLGLGATIIGLGPRSLHADHCIILINHELDRIEVRDNRELDL